uniref:Uncharacterized protein n=1 Tax=Spongospora subterranea TaxID=70186 RepID=A0A0H5QWP9_9EUKA|eukprot:CRZ06172.1 hypothetical protein [Spongospora subterranea]
MVRLVCPATCIWVEAKFSDRAIIIHSDRHSHAVPHVLKPDFYCKKMLTDRICNNPMAKAVTLVTGTPIIGSVFEIHESNGNLSRVAYFRRQVLRDLGVRLPGLGYLIGLKVCCCFEFYVGKVQLNISFMIVADSQHATQWLDSSM